MTATSDTAVDRFLSGLEKRTPASRSSSRPCAEFAEHVMPLVTAREELQTAQILERMTEADRIVIFRVTWQDDEGNLRANRAWRVQFNNSLGPYKGGLRFHPAYCAQKLLEQGARVVALSDSGGTVYDPYGLDSDKLDFVRELKEQRRGRVSEYAERYACEYLEGERPWGIECELAFPCATQNELDEDDARTLIDNGCRAVVEGANMPTTAEASRLLRSEGVLFAPGKAANAGGVAASGLEQSQNAVRIAWTREEVDERLHAIIGDIHSQCVAHGQDGDGVDYALGADRAAFERVAEAMLAHGAV